MGGVLLPPGANRGARVWFHEEEYAAFFMLGDHAIHNLGLYLVDHPRIGLGTTVEPAAFVAESLGKESLATSTGIGDPLMFPLESPVEP